MDVQQAYNVLGLQYNSNTAAIKKVYHKLALQHHPDRCPNDLDAVKKFNRIKKAYEVLIKFQKEEKKRNNTAKVNSTDEENTPTQQPPPNEFDLELTLEEMLTGCTKEQTIKRRVATSTSETTEDASLKVVVKPGSIPSTRITVDQQGDRLHNKIPANAVFIIKEKPHSIFKRNKFNLEYTANITSKEAVLGVHKLEIPTLEKETMTISVSGIINNDTFHKIPNRGLPFGEGKRGELIVKFNILYETQQEQAIEHKIFVSLNQIVSGSTKKVKITRKITDNKNVTTTENEDLIIEIQRGMENETKVTFPKKGDIKPGIIPADVIFTILYAKHEHFTVIGNDLEYTAKITKTQFVNGDKISIPSLDKQNITLFLDSISDHSVIKKFNKRGLPFANEPTKRGNLLVKFKLVDDVKPTATVSFPYARKDDDAKQRQQNDKFPKRVSLPAKEPQVSKLKNDIEKFENLFKQKDKETETLRPATLSKINSSNNLVAEKVVKLAPKLDPIDKVFNEVIENSLFQSLKSQYSQNSSPPLLLPRPRFQYSKINTTTVVNKKNPPVIHDLYLTLENVLNGCNRRAKIHRKLFNKEQPVEDKIVTIKIPKGTKAGHEFVFRECGDEMPGTIASDVIFRIADQKHRLFKRQDANIEYNVTITEKEAFEENIITIPTLEKLDIPFTLNKYIKDGSTWVIGNRGLPFAKDPTKRGNLVIKFTVLKSLNWKAPVEKLPKLPELPRKDPPVETKISLSLRDIFYGYKLEQRIKRRIIKPDGQKEDQEKVILIDITPGCLPGTRLRFQSESNQLVPGRVPADLIFITTDMEHPVFKRKGSNIEYTVKVTEEEAERGVELEAPCLEEDGKGFRKLHIESPIFSGMVKTLPDQGLPKVERKGVRGKLNIRFEVVANSFKDPDIEETLELTADELKHGCSQRYEYERQYYDLEGNVQFEKRSLELIVEPKTKVPAVFKFPRIGVAQNGRISADLTVFVKKAKSNGLRKKDLLQKISLFNLPRS